MVELPERWEGMPLLPEKWWEVLRAAGETGMGYQTGDVTLKDGTVFRDVVFVRPYLAGMRGRARGDVPFQTADIENIDITHKRWNWEW
jgi:hypothetical protein